MATPNQSFTFNAYQSNLAGPLIAGLTTVVLDFIPPGLGVPAYLVIDPDVPASREYIKVLAYTNTTIDNMERGLEGSAGDVDHLVGAVIRAVYTMQALDDTFLDIGQNATNLQTHIDDVGDPHAAAGYLKNTEADTLYLKLAGGTLTGPLILDADPTVALGAATKQYTDLFLPLSGGTMTGAITLLGLGSTGITFPSSESTNMNLTAFDNGDVEFRRGVTTFLRFNSTATTVEVRRAGCLGTSRFWLSTSRSLFCSANRCW